MVNETIHRNSGLRVAAKESDYNKVADFVRQNWEEIKRDLP